VPPVGCSRSATFTSVTPHNRDVLLGLRPGTSADWLIAVGDVAERMADVTWALELLSGRFARVIWAPGQPRALDHPG
jgi:3',5'-cyclic AMP phosphodiesterase CpdA